MLEYGHLNKDKYDDCLTIAKNAADYLIKVSNENDSIYKGLPITYYYKFRKQYPSINNETAEERIDYLHLIDSVLACDGLLYLYEETKDEKYLNVALLMKDFLKKNVKKSGSFSMMYSLKENKEVFENEAVPYNMVYFLKHLYKITKDESLLDLCMGCIKYIKNNVLETTNFEGQFEDSTRSDNYSNLSSVMSVACLEILLEDENVDLEDMKSVLRFIEDQFVIWDKPCPFKPSIRNPRVHDPKEFHYPAGLEQYQWYIPIDASTAWVIKGYLALYKKTNDPILLEKACVLASSITNMQNDSGMIPTQWYRDSVIEDGGDLWINCLFETASVLNSISKVAEK